MLDSVRTGSDLVMTHAEDIGFHYARTLRDWCDRFMANRDTLDSLGYDKAFRRLWLFYLCYCEGGFSEGYIGNVQMVFSKPRDTRELRAPIELSCARVSEAAA